MEGHGPPLKITWLGHATTLIELDGVRVLTDPVLGGRIGPLVRRGPVPRVAAVGEVDCVLLSHLHADHADLRSLREVERSGPIVAPRGVGPWLTSSGLRRVRELPVGGEVGVSTLRVRAVRACHGRQRRPFGPAADPVGYLVRGSMSVYFAGDTDLFPAMAELQGLVDIALLPVGGWGPRLGPGHLNPERAAEAAALIAPRLAVPIHFGTFTLGLSPRQTLGDRTPALEFAAAAERYAPAVEVRILEPMQSTVCPPVADGITHIG
jgi:L-ascorbate metabolism protein UlaG (beta-lactamase superfamily)